MSHKKLRIQPDENKDMGAILKIPTYFIRKAEADENKVAELSWMLRQMEKLLNEKGVTTEQIDEYLKAEQDRLKAEREAYIQQMIAAKNAPQIKNLDGQTLTSSPTPPPAIQIAQG